MDKFGNKPRPARSLAVAYRAVPVQNSRSIGVGIVCIIQMRPVALAHNKVGNAIPIHIGNGRAMWLREHDSASTLRRSAAHNQMLDEGYLSGARALLLKPCQTPAVCLQGGNDII